MSDKLKWEYLKYYGYYKSFISNQFYDSIQKYYLTDTDKNDIKSELKVRFLSVVERNFKQGKKVEYPQSYSYKVLNNKLKDILSEWLDGQIKQSVYLKEMTEKSDKHFCFDICMAEVVEIIMKANLTSKEHMAFVSHRSGMNYKEIATELNISIDAVKKRHYRAKVKILNVFNQ